MAACPAVAMPRGLLPGVVAHDTSVINRRRLDTHHPDS